MFSKKWSALVLMFFSLSSWAAPDFPQRILFVGNSYYYYNNSLHNHLRGFVEATQKHKQHPLAYKSATIGGATLDHHPIDWLTEPGRIGVKEAFEWVVLAGNSADALKDSSQQKFHETVRRYDEVIRSRGGNTALYMTHAYVSPHKQVSSQNIGKVVNMFDTVGRDVGVKVIPVGLAFELSYKRKPDLRLHDEHDGSHPSLVGTYLAAAVVYASLYGENPVGNTYSYRGKVPADVALHLQQVAWDTVVNRSKP
ncbi:hypothetical protein [Limnohabitans sp. Rim8]|uniref:hypothetical protein n=1 Tax=Limnohabitans sp. Rim8 TaxID=1100718 RepID=UPI0025D6F7E0|nr:hypothetical protein [Limnohabitans sp. Rim8]